MDSREAGRIVQGSEITQLLDAGDYGIIQTDRLTEPLTPMNDAMADGLDLRLFQMGHYPFSGLPVVLDRSLFLSALRALVRHLKPSRAADTCDGSHDQRAGFANGITLCRSDIQDPEFQG